ncbi:hypothetical protein GF325_14250 [Candidatus Bathyarchaeota archaeon]|nr:hypothetical protein [Candidatus Bathyarchaeota archaeon]
MGSKSRKRDGRKKKGGTWGKQLGGIYRLVYLVHRFRLYRLFKHVPDAAIGRFAVLFRKAFFGKAEKMRRRIKNSLFGLTGKQYPPAFTKEFASTVLNSMSHLLLDLMLKVPNYMPRDLPRLMTFEGLDILDDALKQGKGILMPSVHVGQFFHCVGGLLFHKNGYKVAAVGNLKNRDLFEIVVGFPQYARLKVVGKDKYKTLKDELIECLSQNYIVFLMHDIAKRNNLKTQFIPGNREILAPTPQGIVALHGETGAPIIPIVSIPTGIFTRSKLKILDPSPILDIMNDPSIPAGKEFHGRISTAINSLLFPYTLSYMAYWEEIMTFGSRVLDGKITLPKNSTFQEIIEIIEKELQGLIENSYELERKDQFIINFIRSTMDELRQVHAQESKEHDQDVRLHRKSSILIGGLTTREQLEKIFGVITKILKEARYHDTAMCCRNQASSIKFFFQEARKVPTKEIKNANQDGPTGS